MNPIDSFHEYSTINIFNFNAFMLIMCFVIFGCLKSESNLGLNH